MKTKSALDIMRDEERKKELNAKLEKATPAHTPTPWKLIKWSSGRRIEGPNGLHIVTMTGNTEDADADAAFIVQAVNAHSELLRLAEHLSDQPYALTPDQWASEARLAIAKAEGKRS